MDNMLKSNFSVKSASAFYYHVSERYCVNGQYIPKGRFGQIIRETLCASDSETKTC